MSEKPPVISTTTISKNRRQWMPYRGPRGGEGWLNTATGEVVYQEERPGSSFADFDEDYEVARTFNSLPKGFEWDHPPLPGYDIDSPDEVIGDQIIYESEDGEHHWGRIEDAYVNDEGDFMYVLEGGGDELWSGMVDYQARTGGEPNYSVRDIGGDGMEMDTEDIVYEITHAVNFEKTKGIVDDAYAIREEEYWPQLRDSEKKKLADALHRFFPEETVDNFYESVSAWKSQSADEGFFQGEWFEEIIHRHADAYKQALGIDAKSRADLAGRGGIASEEYVKIAEVTAALSQRFWDEHMAGETMYRGISNHGLDSLMGHWLEDPLQKQYRLKHRALANYTPQKSVANQWGMGTATIGVTPATEDIALATDALANVSNSNRLENEFALNGDEIVADTDSIFFNGTIRLSKDADEYSGYEYHKFDKYLYKQYLSGRRDIEDIDLTPNQTKTILTLYKAFREHDPEKFEELTSRYGFGDDTTVIRVVENADRFEAYAKNRFGFGFEAVGTSFRETFDSVVGKDAENLPTIDLTHQNDLNFLHSKAPLSTQEVADRMATAMAYATSNVQQKEWTPYRGPQGGEGWQHTETGEVRYTDEQPDEHSESEGSGEPVPFTPQEDVPDALDPAAAERVVPFSEAFGARGISADSMWVAEYADGRRAFVTNLNPDRGEAEKDISAERAMASYEFLSTFEGEGFEIPPHAYVPGEYIAVAGAEGIPASDPEATADRETYVRTAAANLLAGNIDLHENNIFVDGETLFPIDLDLAGEPLTAFPEIGRQAMGNVLRTGGFLGVVDEESVDEFTDAVVREAERLAGSDAVANAIKAINDPHYKQTITVNVSMARRGKFLRQYKESRSWWERLLGKEWKPYRGPKGGEGWQHTTTGEVRYVEDKPEDEGESAIDPDSWNPDEFEANAGRLPEDGWEETTAFTDIAPGDYVWFDHKDTSRPVIGRAIETGEDHIEFMSTYGTVYDFDTDDFERGGFILNQHQTPSAEESDNTDTHEPNEGKVRQAFADHKLAIDTVLEEVDFSNLETRETRWGADITRLDNSEALTLRRAIRDQLPRPDAITDLWSNMQSVKHTAAGRDAARVEALAKETFGLEGKVIRDDIEWEFDKSDKLAMILYAAASQHLLTELLGEDYQLYRGLSQSGAATFARAWLEDPEADAYEIEETVTANYTSFEDIAKSFAHRGLVLVDSDPEQNVINANDFLRGYYRSSPGADEAEVWLPGGNQRVSPANIQLGRTLPEGSYTPRDFTLDEVQKPIEELDEVALKLLSHHIEAIERKGDRIGLPLTGTAAENAQKFADRCEEVFGTDSKRAYKTRRAVDKITGVSATAKDRAVIDLTDASNVDWLRNGREQQDDEPVSKQEASAQEQRWQPYTGPRGGEGWKNTVTGEVRYTENPPTQSDEGEESEGQSTVGEYDTPVQGDRVRAVTTHGEHIEGTYARIDGDWESGQTWALIESNDGRMHPVDFEDMEIIDPVLPNGELVDIADIRIGDKIEHLSSGGVRYEGWAIEQAKDGQFTFVTDDGHEFTVNENDRFGRVEEQGGEMPTRVLAHTLPFHSFTDRDKRRLKQFLVDGLVESTDEDIMRNTLEYIKDIGDKSDANYWSHDDRHIRIAENAEEYVIAHEVMHAFADSYGHAHDRDYNITAKFFVTDLPLFKFGMPRNEAFATMVAETHSETDEEYNEYYQKILKLSEIVMDNPDAPMDKEGFLLTPDGDRSESAPEKATRLFEAINEMWLDIAGYIERGETAEANERIPLRPYTISNCHELLAGLQQLMHTDNGEHVHLATFYEYYPEVIDAYLDIAEPNEHAKRFLALLKEARQ